MLDILFVHPNASKVIYQDLSKNNSAIEPPIWAAMLANSVRVTGKSVSILDAEVENLTYSQTAEIIININPRVICFVVYGQQPSASSQNMEGATKVSQIVKNNNPNAFILFVGGHVAALPQHTILNEKSIDAVCSNEGVYTIRSLLKINKFEDIYLKKVEGLVFRNTDGQIITNISSPIVPKKLLEHDLPGMAWDLLKPLKNYRTAGWHSWSNNSDKSPFAALYTSLGCPYKCSFCMINIINKIDPNSNKSSEDFNQFRWWNPEFIIKQFDYLAKEGIKNIKIADELFVLNPNHFMKICDLIIERKYNFNIWAYSRIDTCKPIYLEKLAKAGIKWLGLGIENPDNEHRKVIHKSGFQQVTIKDQIKIIQDHGINVGGNYIFGLPHDTKETMKNTLEFAMENLTDMVNFYCAMAYPGSPLYNESVKKKITLPSSYSGYSQHSYDTTNLSSLHLTAPEILKFRDKAFNKYHENPKYQNLLKNKFGKKAVDDLKKTLKITLKRKLLGDKQPDTI